MKKQAIPQVGTMNTGALSISEKEYRLSKSYLEWGLVCALCFGIMGVLTVAAALNNADGSFRHPVAAAIFMGGIWFGLTAVACLLILCYYRYSLIVSRDVVRRTGCFMTREVRLVFVNRADWGSLVKGGTLLLSEDNRRLKIHFANYTFRERAELIEFFRAALPATSQEGWDRFESRCMPPRVEYKELRSQVHRLLRFMVIAWAIALPFMYAIMIWLKLIGGLPNGNWLVVGLFPLGVAGAFVGLSWLAARGDLARARGRGDID
jgi:hypothetical protein